MNDLQKIAREIVAETEKAMMKFNRFNSAHEGWAVIKEELEELWCQVVPPPDGTRFWLMSAWMQFPEVSVPFTVPGALTQISVGSDGEVWGLNNVAVTGGFKIFRWNGAGWDLKAGGLTKIVVASASHIWGINSSGTAFYWNGASWVQAGSKTWTQLDAADDGTVIGLDDSSYPWTYAGGAWSQLGTTQKALKVFCFDASISSYNLWIQPIAANDNNLALWNGSGWTNRPDAPNQSAPATQYVGKDGSLWSYVEGANQMSPNFDNIYQYVGGVWQAASGGWIMKVLVIAKDATKLGLLSGIFGTGTFLKSWAEFS